MTLQEDISAGSDEGETGATGGEGQLDNRKLLGENEQA